MFSRAFTRKVLSRSSTRVVLLHLVEIPCYHIVCSSSGTHDAGLELLKHLRFGIANLLYQSRTCIAQH